jgi:carbamoyl-phosphate synthase large subunit
VPRRSDLTSVLVIGSGPVTSGQAAEFDHAGTQACRLLRAEGLRVTLVNSNPSTLMTDPEFADATYVEPVTPGTVERVIAKERPDALLSVFGGQAALDTTVALHESGVLARYGVELIGTDIDAVRVGGDRGRFRRIVERIGAETARGSVCHSLEECRAAAEDLGYPVMVRPSSTMGGSGSGSGLVHEERGLAAIAGAGTAVGPACGVLLEESLLGWKQFEFELVRDRNDNVVVVCSIEHLEPVGVHPGDSIAVAPAMTLTEQEYQRMRGTAVAVIRAVGVDTGGCNVRFAVDPRTGRMVVVGMRRWVSWSSALASKATGFPIAGIAARLAIGYTLDEIRDGSTRQTLADFEPGRDHVAVKVPQFALDALDESPTAGTALTTRRKSVGAAMAIGRSFPEAFNKALRSLDRKGSEFSWAGPVGDKDALVAAGALPTDGRITCAHQAIRAGATVDELAAATGIDPWFLEQVVRIELVARSVAEQPGTIGPETLLTAKRHGLSDAQIGQLRGLPQEVIRELRRALGIRPVYRTVDTCAGGSAARTPYLYSTYAEQAEVQDRTGPKVIILGSGANRIGQGSEFDYACVHAGLALAAVGYETVVVNCNPEAVSTDGDSSHRLYFEPLTFEDVLEVVAAEQATGEVVGVLVQLGGRTPWGLAGRLADAGVPVVGTSPAGIGPAEDRSAFGGLLARVGLPAPRRGTAASYAEARRIAEEIGYPVLVRPGCLPSGRDVEVVHDDRMLAACVEKAATVSSEHPILVDRFLDGAVEIGVDALYDGTELYLGGVMEHIEEAGVHRGGSACALPPVTLGRADVARAREYTRVLAAGMEVRGLLNVQYALVAGILYVLEASPRAGRTVPFVSKATGVPLAKAAARVMLGATIAELRAEGMLPTADDSGGHPPDAAIAVKESVRPWNRFRTQEGHDMATLLGPEMRFTGEAMAIDAVFGTAYAKSQAAAYGRLPGKGRALVSVANRDKRAMVLPVKALADSGFEILATAGTAEVLRRNGIRATTVRKHSDGVGPDSEPTVVGRILAGEVDIIVNTQFGAPGRAELSQGGCEIRTAAAGRGIPCFTTVQGLAAAVQGIKAFNRGDAEVTSLQEHALKLRGSMDEQPSSAVATAARPASSRAVGGFPLAMPSRARSTR